MDPSDLENTKNIRIINVTGDNDWNRDGTVIVPPGAGDILISEYHSQDVRLIAVMSIIIILLLVLAWVCVARRIVKVVRRNLALQRRVEIEPAAPGTITETSDANQPSGRSPTTSHESITQVITAPTVVVEPNIDHGGKGDDSWTCSTKRHLGKSMLTVFTLPKLLEQSDEEGSRFESIPEESSSTEGFHDAQESIEYSKVNTSISNILFPKVAKQATRRISTPAMACHDNPMADCNNMNLACGERVAEKPSQTSNAFSSDSKITIKEESTARLQIVSHSISTLQELSEVNPPPELPSLESSISSSSSDRSCLNFFSPLGSTMRFTRGHSTLRLFNPGRTFRDNSRAESVQNFFSTDRNLRTSRSVSPRNLFTSDRSVRDCRSTAASWNISEGTRNEAPPSNVFSSTASVRGSKSVASPVLFFNPQVSLRDFTRATSPPNLSILDGSFRNFRSLTSPQYFSLRGRSMQSINSVSSPLNFMTPEGSIRSVTSPQNFFTPEGSIGSSTSPQNFLTPQGSTRNLSNAESPQNFLNTDWSMRNVRSVTSPQNFVTSRESMQDLTRVTSPDSFFSPLGSLHNSMNISFSQNYMSSKESFKDCTSMTSPSNFFAAQGSFQECRRPQNYVEQGCTDINDGVCEVSMCVTGQETSYSEINEVIKKTPEDLRREECCRSLLGEFVSNDSVSENSGSIDGIIAIPIPEQVNDDGEMNCDVSRTRNHGASEPGTPNDQTS